MPLVRGVPGNRHSYRDKQFFTQHSYDLALIDLRLPDCNGIELLKIFKTAVPDQGLMCIMMTAYGSVDSAVQAKKYNINNMIAVDPLMIKTFEVVKKVVANRDVSVLIQGESVPAKNWLPNPCTI